MRHSGEVNRAWLNFFGLALFFLAGCGSLKATTDIDSSCERPPVVSGAGNISIFLNVRRHAANPKLTVKLASLELLVDDFWVPILAEQLEVNAAPPLAIQRFIGRQWIKGQYCRGVRIRVASAVLADSEGERALPLLNADTEILLASPVAIEPGSRMLLLLEWNPEGSLSAQGFQGMAMTADLGGTARITANLAYVACPDLDTVYVVRTDKYQVVDAFPVQGNPTYLVADPERKKIYVLAADLAKIISYDLATHQPGVEIQVPLANSPIFMTANLRSQTAYVLDNQGVVTSIDLVSGNLLNRQRVGNRPNYLYYIQGVEKLAVSSSVDQSVYLLGAETLAVEEQIPLASAPLGLGSWENYLYIAEGYANSVSLYDLTTRRLVKNIHVGNEPGRFVASDSSVYVTNYLAGSITMLQGGEFGVSKEVAIGGSAIRELAVAEKQRLLFVGAGDCDGSLVAVDTTGNQVIGRIELGAKPLGLAVVE